MDDVRASDAEREATVVRLRDAAAEGRLTLEELAERVEAADGARWGGSNIIVPHGVHVEHQGRGLLGWDEVDPPEGDPPPPGAPVVRIRSLSIMGGTDVKRGAPRPWRWPWQRRQESLPPS
jgi:Domain of unknown function (DUF1707)